MIPPKRMAVLFSGGIDSAIAIDYYLKKNFTVLPLYIQTKLSWENAERRIGKRFLQKIATPKLLSLCTLQFNTSEMYQGHWSQTGDIPGRQSPDESVFLPARNLVLLTQALLILPARGFFNIAIGTLRDNPFPDGTKDYFQRLSRIFSQSIQKPFCIHTPFRQIPKSQLLKKNFHLPLADTLSCINPQDTRHCGRCNKCVERKRAFQKSGIPDSTAYTH